MNAFLRLGTAEKAQPASTVGRLQKMF